MSNHIDLQNQTFSFLGKDSKINGNFFLQGTTRISSKLEGELIMEDSSDLCIEREGSVEGKIECHNIEIFGHFSGTLKASGIVTIFPPATISGEVNAQNLIIHPGAIVNITGHTMQ